jgi:ABC-2 type transport system ATP-binding protein
MSIEVQSVSKSYGEQLALNEVSFSAGKGEIIGFLGPNGAGKSTMMKILTGYIVPNAGEVSVGGTNVLSDAIQAQAKIGYLPEQNPLYKDMFVREYLSFRAGIFNIGKERIETVIELVGLTPEVKKKIGQLSKGYQQRVGIAAAILHDPEVLILDEPTTGLDPNQLQEIRTLIKDLGKEKTILFSTHIMQEVEAVCDRVIIIKKGAVLLDKPLQELKQSNEQTITVTFDSKVKSKELKTLPNLISSNKIEGTTWQLTFNAEEDMRAAIFDFAQEQEIKILELNSQNQSLESLFKEVTNS